MNIAQLIIALLQAAATYGPELVHTVAELIHGNPKQQDETDEAYITRLNGLIDAKLADAEAKDKKVEGEEAPTQDPL